MTDVHHVGEAYAWIEQDSSIHLKAIEMTAEEARELGRELLELADRLTQLDALDG